MGLVPWNPFRDIGNISRDLGDFMGYLPSKLFGGFTTPKIDIYQTEDDVIIKAEIPGISKEDLNLYIDEDSIRISGQTKRENEFKEEDTYRTERYFGKFSRTIPLPVEIKSEKTRAEYKDGILTIEMPKLEPSKSKGRRIDIQ